MKQLIVLFFLVFLLWQSACVKEQINTSSEARISFSVDTLHFDTVFTQVGSATRLCKIFNHESQDIILDKIEMRGGAQSQFRINVDGLEGPVVREVRVPAKDSIYVFVEVTVHPDQPTSVSPFVIEDYLTVEYNGKVSELLIDAWGQNANYIPSRLNRTKVYRLDCNDQLVWDDPKPYVIYGLLYIDSCELYIAGGTRIHVHGGLGRRTDTSGNVTFFNDGNIIVGPSGRVISSGSVNEPVIFQGDRLEPEFEQVPGQWNGIRFLPGSHDNSFSSTIIRNSVFGIYLDSLGTLTLDKSIIYNTSSVGLFCFHPQNVMVRNCLFFNSGAQSLAFSCGGNYQLEYVTVGNYGNDKEGVFMSNNYCYDFPDCERWCYNDINAQFTNCVLTGNNRDELWLSAADQANVDLTMTHCVIRIEDLLKAENWPNFLSEFTQSTVNWQRTDSLFADVGENDYRPDTLSILEGKALPIRNVTTDLQNNPRDFSNPDLGCYEYQY